MNHWQGALPPFVKILCIVPVITKFLQWVQDSKMVLYSITSRSSTPPMSPETPETQHGTCVRDALGTIATRFFDGFLCSLRGSGKGHEQLWHWKSNLIDTGNHRYRWFCKTTGKTHSMTHVWPEAVPSVFDDLCQMAAQVASGQVKHADIEQIHTQGLTLGRNCCGLKATIEMFCGWSTKSRFKRQHYFETFWMMIPRTTGTHSKRKQESIKAEAWHDWKVHRFQKMMIISKLKTFWQPVLNLLPTLGKHNHLRKIALETTWIWIAPSKIHSKATNYLLSGCCFHRKWLK